MTINDHHNHSDFSEKTKKCQDYIQALEQERCKIQVFQRELPLCLELVTQAIETCKQQLSGTTTTTEYNIHEQSECSEQTSNDNIPVLEEFIPIKRASSSHSDEEEEEEQESKKVKNGKKSDWLRSVQLWNQTPDPPPKQDSPRKVAVTEVKRNGGAFHPFKKDKSTPATAVGTTTTAAAKAIPPKSASTSSTAETGGGGNKKEEKESQRKSRRCWSPELHRRFLQALQQLGGSHLATPKQIRELMKVDGLTNDEVKSHLQKYRLHTRRPNSSTQNNNNNNQQAPQFVVVGGIWVQPEYAAMAATATTSGEAASGVATPSNGIYAPIAALPPPFRQASASSKQRQHKPSSNSDEGEGGCSHSEGGGVQSHSPATSSSTHTTTASPAY